MIRPRKVAHVVLNGQDLEKMERFYTEVLGFEVVTRTKRPRGVFFSLGTQHHDLAVLQAAANCTAATTGTDRASSLGASAWQSGRAQDQLSRAQGSRSDNRRYGKSRHHS